MSFTPRQYSWLYRHEHAFLGLDTHLFVKVPVPRPRPGDSEVLTFLVFESSCHLLLQSNHSKVEAIPLSALPKNPVKCLAQGHNKRTCLSQEFEVPEIR